MSTEPSKVVWITVAVSAFLLVVAIFGVFVFYPRNQAPAAPATAGNTAAPKPLDPQDYLNAPATAPAETKRNNGDVIVIYGDKPQSVPPLGSPAESTTVNPGQAVPPDQGVAPTNAANVPTVSDTGVTSSPSTVAGDQTSTQTPATAAPAAAPAGKKSVAMSKPSGSTAKTGAKPAVATTTALKKNTARKPAIRTTQYWIQAASFAERGKADGLRDGLASNGIASLIAVKDIAGKSWYRVRVGPYSSAAEATGWLAKVKLQRGCEEAYVATEAP